MAPVRASLLCASSALLFLSIPEGFAEPKIRIIHEPIACVTRGDFVVIRARTDPEKSVDRLSVLVRSASEPSFSRIDLTATSDGFVAILPLPSAGSEAIVYYLEAIVGPFRATTPEYRARVEQVASECKTETSPGPPGDIQGSSPPKKRRRGAFLALGAVGGAALGIGALAGGQEETGAPEPPAPPPPVDPPAPPTLEPVSACFELPSTGEVGIPIRMDASCSNPRGSLAYEWNLGDGRTKEGRVVTPFYSTPGLYFVELRVVRLAGGTSSLDEDRLEKTVLILDSAAPPDEVSTTDLSIDKLGALSSRIVDGVLHFHIAYTLTVKNRGRSAATQVRVLDDLMSDLTLSSSTPSQGTCDTIGQNVNCLLGLLPPGAQATVRLEVDVRPGVPENTSIANTATVQSATQDLAPANDQDTETTVLRRPPNLTSFSAFESSFISTIETPARNGSVIGSVQANGVPLGSVNDATSFRHRVRAVWETVEVTGTLESASQGLWRFDLNGLNGDGRVIPGSIELLEGQVLGREPLAITFHLTGRPGERVRFTYRHRR